MNENNSLKAFLAFLFVFTVMALIPPAHAFSTVNPIIPAYTQSTSQYKGASGSFTYSTTSGYSAPATVNLGGRAISVPAKLGLAANAGQLAKNAMKLNPGLLVGTLALPWLIDQGLEYVNGQWVKNTSSYPLPGSFMEPCLINGSQITPDACIDMGLSDGVLTSMQQACLALSVVTYPGRYFVNSYGGVLSSLPRHGVCVFPNGVQPSTTGAPATQEDWDGLPDPLPDVAPELPYAPYMPNGAPVRAPVYDFAPMDVPVGDPYTKPDGSTAQPKAKVSPNGDSVTIDTYDQPLTDTNGQPVPNPTPQDTPEPQPDPCTQNPDRIGCANFGTPAAPDAIATDVIPVNTTIVPIGNAGTCPASVTTTKFGLTWSYQPICDFATAIKPFILAFAWVAFAYIVAGTVRT